MLWAEGEVFLLTGPTGVGKTTLGGQVVAARIGVQDTVLGYPVTIGRRVLYLAMDRPNQIRRSLARQLRRVNRDLLDDRLVVWRGPPPAGLAKNPKLLYQLALAADADTVVIDSLKDAAVKLSDEETGQGITAAMSECIANGVQVMAFHHQTKRGAGGVNKPKDLAAVYGSNWITAGAGSVVLLWGAAGAPVVELIHLKQPVDEIGPLKLVHNHANGTTELFENVGIVELLAGQVLSVREIAVHLFGGPIDDTKMIKTRSKIDALVKSGEVIKVASATSGSGCGSKGGGGGARYTAVLADTLDDTAPPAKMADTADYWPTHTSVPLVVRPTHWTTWPTLPMADTYHPL